MSSARVTFSSDFFDEKNFITISPRPPHMGTREDKVIEVARGKNGEFEFLSGSSSARHMLTADELFYEGKLLPSWQKQQSEKFSEMRLRAKVDTATDEEGEASGEEVSKGDRRLSWYVDDDPSPRPPKCTVLWKELLRLKKKRSSSSSSSSPSSSLWSLGNKMVSIDEEKEMGEGKKEKYSKRVIKKGLERTRSASIRIRPMVNVPAACTQGQGRGSSTGLPPLFSLRKVREVRR